ncbi:MAG: glycosyltransferase family 4 protein [Elusimicrobia bacterium]|nr:glycosyltransferase family 4 protein [Elusimicrobiota bacterium]
MQRRILYTVPALTMGGVASVLDALVRGASGAGYEVHVAYYEKADADFAASLSEAAEVHYAGTSCRLPLLRPALIARRIGALVSDLRPQLVHAHSFDADLLSARALAGLPVPFLVSCHTFSYVRTARSLRKAYARFAPRITSFVAVSEALAAALKTVPELASRPVAVIHNAASARFFEPLPPEGRASFRSRLGVGEDEILIGYVANFHPGKRHSLLSEAFCRMKAKNVRLAFMGMELDAGAAGLARDALRKHGQLERCAFISDSSDSHAFLQACDIYAHPSSSEAFSVALAEAAASGLPIAAMNVGGNPELAIEGRNALLCGPEDAGCLAGALDKLAADAALRNSMGAASREIAAERAHPVTQMRKYLELYGELSGRQS